MTIITNISLGLLLFFSLAAGKRNLQVCMLKALHLLQLEDYSPYRMLRMHLKQIDFKKGLGLEHYGILIIVGVFTVISLTEKKINLLGGNLTFVLVVGFSFVGFTLWYIGVRRAFQRKKVALESAKKKLVMTNRAKRIKRAAYLTTAIFLAVYLAMVVVYYLSMYDKMAHPIGQIMSSPYSNLLSLIWIRSGRLFILVAIFLFVPLTSYIVSRVVPVFLTISIIVLSPHEKLTQLRFMRDAKSILMEFKPLVIGITGSYGKTSVKEILTVLLSESYNVCTTPSSYNTLMGVTRVIREKLRHYHEVFIVEMGAYREGSIAKLCHLTEPTHGLITIIGLQHLERFQSQRSIQRAKGELIRALPSNGIAILNADDPLSCEIGADYAVRAKYFSMSRASRDKEVVFVSNVELSLSGSRFDVNFPDGDVISISLPLLGRSAIINAVAAMTMADILGVNRIFMKKALVDIPQVRHRLELILRADGVMVIDDAFNSNPIGAAHALEVLSKATAGKRILITPGMVELGEKEDEANRKFGALAAECCDLVILVGGQRIKPIEQGLISGGFAVENIWIVPGFKAGMERLEVVLKSGDTILIENDLPDQYNNM